MLLSGTLKSRHRLLLGFGFGVAIIQATLLYEVDGTFFAWVWLTSGKNPRSENSTPGASISPRSTGDHGHDLGCFHTCRHDGCGPGHPNGHDANPCDDHGAVAHAPQAGKSAVAVLVGKPPPVPRDTPADRVV